MAVRGLAVCRSDIRGEQEVLRLEPLHIQTSAAKWCGWLGTFFFTFAAIGSYLSGQVIVAVSFLFVLALFVLLVMDTGQITIDADAISESTPLGRHRIEWREVAKVEIDEEHHGIVFEGNDKRLVILGPHYWGLKKRDELFRLLIQQIEQRELPIERTALPSWKSSKNTKEKLTG